MTENAAKLAHPRVLLADRPAHRSPTTESALALPRRSAAQGHRPLTQPRNSQTASPVVSSLLQIDLPWRPIVFLPALDYILKIMIGHIYVHQIDPAAALAGRSEERRVGQACR